MYKMAKEMVVKAKKVVNHILCSLGNLNCIPYKTFFKIFDSKVCPMLLYGCEIWGTNVVSCTENVQNYACKRFLNVKIYACNNSVLGDVGRYPMYIYAYKRVVKYWIRILNMPNTRYVKLCYNMMKFFDSVGHKNWVTSVRTNLYQNGFGYVWELQTVDRPKLFVYEYVERLKDQYKQEWMSQCALYAKLIDYTQLFS